PQGAIHTGSRLTHFECPSGTEEILPGYEGTPFKANVGFGADWLPFDPNGEHVCIDLKAIAKTKDEENISFGYLGIIKMVPSVKKLFSMDPEAKTLPFGCAST
ncbi:hypothetical protein GQ43DRAFT_365293, partial [Delitschia confertaspora ATCC 74209]